MKAGDTVTVNFAVVDAHDKDNVLLEAGNGQRISLSETVLVAGPGPEPEAPKAE